jgi:hypothetical protein
MLAFDFDSTSARQPCPAALPGSLTRQPCLAALPGSLVRQPCPAALPGSLARQPCPAALPGSLARQPCPAALPGSLARQPCPSAGVLWGALWGALRGAIWGALWYVMRVVMRGVLRGVMRELVRTEVIFQSCFALLITNTTGGPKRWKFSNIFVLGKSLESNTEEKVCEMIDQHWIASCSKMHFHGNYIQQSVSQLTYYNNNKKLMLPTE